MDNELERDI